jgi:hypothetical protein
MIDKFASQQDFLITVNLIESTMDSEFYEEMKLWYSDTMKILSVGKTKGSDFIEQYIPRRTMRLSFLNKSNKEVRFTLENAEIEEGIAKNRYLIYVKKMQILK